MLLHHSTKLTLNIRLLLLSNHIAILWLEQTSRQGHVPRLFGTDTTIKKLRNNKYVAIADPVVAPFCPTHIKHSFTMVIESCWATSQRMDMTVAPTRSEVKTQQLSIWRRCRWWKSGANVCFSFKWVDPSGTTWWRKHWLFFILYLFGILGPLQHTTITTGPK
jgi:hypothetical protein